MKKTSWTLLMILTLSVCAMGLFFSVGNTFDINEELKNYDLSTPEKTIDLYIESLKNNDRKGLTISFGNNALIPELGKPVPVKSYEIKKKTIYSKEYVDYLIKSGHMPLNPHHVGDVELQVKVVYNAGENASGTYPYKDGEEKMFTYWFRKSGNYWFLTTLYAWESASTKLYRRRERGNDMQNWPTLSMDY